MSKTSSTNCGWEIKYCAECGELLIKEAKPKKDKIEEPKETPVSTKQSTDDIYAKLREYKQLLDDGTLTKEEYDEIKKQLLN